MAAAQRVRTFTEDQARALARGWPHEREFVIRKSKLSPERRAADALARVDPSSVEWTRAVALAYLRGHAIRPGSVTAAQLDAMTGADDLTRDELAELLDRWTSRPRYWFAFEHALLLGEALLGPDAVVDCVCDWIERHQPTPAERSLAAVFGSALTSPTSLAFLLGFPLLRASEPARERVRELHRRGAGGPEVERLLHLVVGGAAAAREHQVSHLFACAFVDDDPELIGTIAGTEHMFASLSPRFVWLGGAELLEHFIARARQSLPPWYTRRFVLEFGIIAEPAVVRLMAALAGKKPSRAAAIGWFTDHAEFVRTHREQLADAPNAAELLAMIE